MSKDRAVFRNGFHLFTLLGFRVRIAPSWFLLAVLIVWSLAQGYFPSVVEGITPATALWLATAGALGLFASIVFHEFAHALVARRFDMPIEGITLFLFGGVAELRDEPPSPRAEFMVAIAGPLASLLLAAILRALLLPVAGDPTLRPLAALLDYVATINLVLALFNMLPAFPLDGGRVLRAAIWASTGDLRRATRVGAVTGRALGGALMALGVLAIVTTDVVGGMWIALIGLFIVGAAGASEMQLRLKLGLENVVVRDIMTPAPIAAPDDITVAELVDGYFYRHFHKSFPVVRGDRLVGSVRLEDVGRVPRAAWARTPVADILPDRGDPRAVGPDTPVSDALDRMREANVSRLMVVDGGRLVGILTMRDLMQFLAIRTELEAAGGPGFASPGVAGGRRRAGGAQGGPWR